MALQLKRIVHPYEFLRCKISDEVIGYGEYYFEDDEDGLIVKASVYAELKKQKEEEEFDYTLLNNAQLLRDYEEQLKQYEKEYLASTLFDRKVVGREWY